MNFKPEIIKKVRDSFSLNIYETKVWLALISKGVASAGEIADISEVPRSRTYDVLESLEKMGFAMAKIGKPVKYMAVKPTLVIEKLKNKMMTDAKERVEQLSSLKSTQEYAELETLHKEGIAPINQNEMSGAIRGKANIFSHVREILENADSSVIICTSALDLETKSRIFAPLFDRLKKSNINLKVALSGDDNDIKRVSRKFDIKAKKIDIKARFFIADDNQVLFIISNGFSSSNEEEEIGIWINSDFFSSSLSSMFDLAYKSK
jgi:sugar-specific transcriptional regulator TrmB